MNMIGFRRGLARFVEAFARFVPAADVHHGHAALIVIFGAARILFRRGLHALLGNFQVHARAVRQLFAGALEHFFEFLLGARKFLLMKERQRFVVRFQLRLHSWINQFNAAALRGMRCP